MNFKKNKYIFITGNHSHSGKGLIGSSLAYLLKSIGFNIKLLKIANYLNKSGETLNPTDKGDLWITNNGRVISMDWGDYCHILGYEIEDNCNTSLGILLQNILNKEEKKYDKSTLMLSSQLAKELEYFINGNSNEENIIDFTIIEIGGNLGDYETSLILNSINLLDIIIQSSYHINVAFIPKINDIYNIELFKTMYNKIIPHNIKINYIILREPDSLNIEKLLQNIEISNIDHITNIKVVDSIYEIPILLNNTKIVDNILKYFNISNQINVNKNLDFFYKIQEVLNNDKLPIIKVAIIGKDGREKKTYHSLIDGLINGGVYLNKRVQITIFDISLPSEHLKEYDCLVFSGGSGPIFTENIIQYLRYARQNNIPTLMIGLSYQLGLIEIARNIIGIKDATSLEFNQNTGTPIICLMDKNLHPKIHFTNGSEYCRTGLYPIYLNSTSILYPFYRDCNFNNLENKEKNKENNNIFQEKFCHKYWFNHNFRHIFEGSYGIHFSFTDIKNIGIYGFELEEKLHKFYVGVKFHPENSTIKHYHPLFIALLSKSKIN